MAELGEAEELAVRKTFLEMDVDQKGYLDVSELGNVMVKLGMQVSDEQVQQIFETFDVDKNSKLSYDEYLKLVQAGRLSVKKAEEQPAEAKFLAEAALLPGAIAEAEAPEPKAAAPKEEKPVEEKEEPAEVEEPYTEADSRIVNCSLLHQRLRFECYMLRGSYYATLFILVALCIAASLHGYHTPEVAHKIHHQLESSLNLQAAGSVNDLEGIYAFATAFSQRSAALQAASGNYWCESRFFHHSWSSLRVPTRECKSSRLHAIGVSGQPEWPSPKPEYAKTCVDDIAALRQQTGDSTSTCASFPKEVVCSADQAVAKLCRQTCGYCSTFEYDWTKQFIDGQMTFAPVIMFQTRLKKDFCKRGNLLEASRVRAGNGAPARPGVARPSLQGVPGTYEEIMTCSATSSDEIELYDGKWALEIPCERVPGTSKSIPECVLGTALAARSALVNDTTKMLYVTEKHVIGGTLGDPVYPELLQNSVGDVERLKKLSWLDSLTKSLTVGTAVFTREADVYTWVEVKFDIDTAGGIQSHAKLQSYHTSIFLDGTLWAFVAIALTSCALLLTCTGYDRVSCLQPQCLRCVTALTITLVYLAFLYLYWLVLPDIATSNKELLNYMFVASDHKKLIQKLLSLAEYSTVYTEFLDGFSLLGYPVMFMLICGALAKWSLLHPRVGFFTTVLSQGLADLSHLVFVAILLFLLLALSIFPVFGPYVKSYATFPSVLSSQLKWLFLRVLD
jgi:hypothetical protein